MKMRMIVRDEKKRKENKKKCKEECEEGGS
jgi:hypothetical protein